MKTLPGFAGTAVDRHYGCINALCLSEQPEGTARFNSYTIAQVIEMGTTL